MNEEERERKREEERQASREYFAKEFGIPVEDVVWGQVGICYGSIVVKTRESAEKISKIVTKRGTKANGGYMHGMPLGGITSNNDGTFRVTH